jgi:ribosome assembly protein RRB1
MGKQTKRQQSKQPPSSNQDEARSAPALRSPRTEVETKDNLQFEDPFPEEFEEEEGDEEWEDDEGEEEEEQEGNEDAEAIKSWNPLTGEPLEPGQKLEMDPSAYKMHHALNADWPSLTFDFLRDDLGESRTRFPHSMIAAVGTQADRPENNQLTVMRLSDLARIKVETEDDILGDEYNPDKEDDEDDEDSDDEIDLDPVMEHYSIKHYGGVNRIRAMPQESSIIATWSDAGTVNLFNVESIMQRFSMREGKGSAMKDIPSKPFFSYSKHETEGYALDWSLVNKGQLATGDCGGSIHLWTPRPEGGYSVTPSYETDTADRAPGASPSVEDLQWSPTEATVFASAECGGYVRVFDTRAPKKAMLSHKIHANGSDVNVLSWNKLVGNLLATGGDDGVLSAWDLRHFSGEDIKPLARFTPHKTPITSVEWHPTDESMLAVTDDHGAYIYDLSVEEDDTAGQMDVPPQLLFVHCGSEQFKEVHWHPQVPSCLMTTALSGYSVFIPSNL